MPLGHIAVKPSKTLGRGFERAYFVRPPQPRVSREIGGEDRRELSNSGFLPAGLAQAFEHVGVIFRTRPGHAAVDEHVERFRRDRHGFL